MTVLRGIGWDHPRCRGPLERSVASRDVVWSFRSLAAFNDQPVAELADRFDLLVVDHPHVTAAAAAGALAPLDDLLPGGALAAIAADSIGPSYESYSYAGRQWALPVDAACQVSAVRPDLLADSGISRPARWDDVFVLAETRPGSVALPLTPADALCSLLTLCSQRGAPVRVEDGLHFDRAAVELLVKLASVVDERWFGQAPPDLLDALHTGSTLLYVPLTFGYSTFGQTAPRVEFGSPPVDGAAPGGPVLGGAGLAVSARSADPAAAAEVCAWLAGAEAQATIVLPDGQPSSARLWRDPAVDRRFGGFFSATRACLESAYVRPRHPAWPSFQENVSHGLARALADGWAANEVARLLDEQVRAIDWAGDIAGTPAEAEAV